MLFSPLPAALLGIAQVVGHLQVHPEFRRSFEKRAKPDRRVSCDASFILQNRCDRLGGIPFASALDARVRLLRPFGEQPRHPPGRQRGRKCEA
jgi:hypothetical protein